MTSRVAQPTGSQQELRVLVDGRVMQDRYHGIGRYTYELLRELSRLAVDLVILYSPDTGRLDVSELLRAGFRWRPCVPRGCSHEPR
jgi:hypothetical protein